MNGLLAGSFFIGRYFGINVRVHITFLLLAGFRLLDSLGAGGNLTFSAIWMALLFLLILTHEFGHCLAARMVDGDAREILMWPLGGLAFAHAPMTPWAQFVTVAGGPLVNVIWCVAIGVVVSSILGTTSWIEWNPFGGDWVRKLTAAMATSGVGFSSAGTQVLFYSVVMYYISYWLLLFNLLPVYPMDGGQLFMTTIWPLVGLRNAMLTACRVGVGGAVVLGGLGFMHQHWMLIGVALFGAWTCYQQLQGLRYGTPADERIATYGAAGRFRRRRGFWARVFGSGHSPSNSAPAPSRRPAAENPNPGGWDAKMSEEARLDAEVDRILQKVHDHGIGSLTYVEKQTLERARRLRVQRENEV